MFKSIGFVISLYAITQFFASATASFERAMVATFDTIESAALVSETQIESLR